MESVSLPGLERLLDVCQRLNLGLETSSPAREPLSAGEALVGVPFNSSSPGTRPGSSLGTSGWWS